MKKIYYGQASYNSNEINACLKVLKKQSLSLMTGKNVRMLEKKIAGLFGKKYALMVNSGSSANLLAIQSLNLKKNSEVITPTLYLFNYNFTNLSVWFSTKFYRC